MVKKTSNNSSHPLDQKQIASSPEKQALLVQSQNKADLSLSGEGHGSNFSYKDVCEDSIIQEQNSSFCTKTGGSCHKGKISIIGMGMVGSSYAYSLIQSGLARELVIVDANSDRAHGEYLDLSHALSFVPPVRIREGQIADTNDSQLIVICAGVSQSGPGESRLQLVLRNVAVMEKVIPALVEASPYANILVATNPVDNLFNM